MQDNRFDKLVGDKLRGFREEPAPGLFSRIEETLAQGAAPTEKRRGVFFYAWRVGAAAAVLFGLVLGYTLLRNDSGIPADNVAVTTSVQPEGDNTMTGKTTAITTSQETGAKTAQAKTTPKSNSEIILQAIFEDPRTTDIVKTVTEHVDLTGDEGHVGTEITSIEPIELFMHTATEHKEDTRMAQAADSNIYTPGYWEDIFREEHAPRQRKRLSGSVYGGNFGAGTGNYTSNDPAALVSSKMAVYEKSAMDYSGDNYYSAAVYPSADAIATMEETSELKHMMPVNFGLTLSIPVSDRLAIVSGLNYSYLYSNSKQNGTRSASMKQEVHYLGIPLGVTFSVYSTPRWDFYLYGGGMVEKAVSARKTWELEFESGNPENSEKIKVEGVQPSVRVSAGASFMFARGVSLYVEPGVAYYFEQVKNIRTYRTEYPTNFSLTVGIKFGL